MTQKSFTKLKAAADTSAPAGAIAGSGATSGRTAGACEPVVTLHILSLPMVAGQAHNDQQLTNPASRPFMTSASQHSVSAFGWQHLSAACEQIVLRCPAMQMKLLQAPGPIGPNLCHLLSLEAACLYS
jgi:hypothetical protein